MSGLNTRLITKRIGNPSEAAAVMGTYAVQGGSRLTPIILIPERNPCTFWISIPEGFYSIVTAHDRYIGIWHPGFHFVQPWQKISHMVTQQYIIYDTPVKECPTIDNVMVEVDVSVVFHIKEYEEDVKNFVYKLGPERLESMLNAFQQEAVRTMARQKKYSSIYDLMDTEELELPQKVAIDKEKEAEDHLAVAGELESEPVHMPGQGVEMTTLAKKPSADPADFNKDGRVDAQEQLENTKRVMNDKLGPYGVKVYSITITNVLLPTEFRNQMEEATTFDSKNIKLAAEQKFRLLVIEDAEKRAQSEQALKEELEEAKAANAQRVASELKITSLYEAGTQAIIADVEEKMHSDVREIKAKSSLKVATLNKEKEVEMAAIQAEADAETVRIRTEMEAFVMTSFAETKAKVAVNNAAALKFTADAENTAANKLKAKRDFEAKMSHLRILKNLALNDQVAISGKNTDSVVAQLLAAKNNSVALGLPAM